MDERLAKRLCVIASSRRTDRRQGITEAGLRAVCVAEGHEEDVVFVFEFARREGWLR